MTVHPGPVFVFGEAMIELSKVQARNAQIGVAGDTFNTAVYIARAGISTQYVTALGDDPFSAHIRNTLCTEMIKTSHVLTVAGSAPGLYAISLDDQNERSFTYWRSASAAKKFFKAPNINNAIKALSQAKVLYLSGITLSIFDEDGRGKILEICKAIKNAGGEVIFDTNYRANGWQSRQDAAAAIKAIMPYVSTALPTWEDEQDLFSTKDAYTCAQFWHDAGVNEVVVKAGQQGAYSQKTGWVAPPKDIKPIDTTGVGDAFNGAYISARLLGAAPYDAIQKAHKLAAQVLMTNGAIILPGH